MTAQLNGQSLPSAAKPNAKFATALCENGAMPSWQTLLKLGLSDARVSSELFDAKQPNQFNDAFIRKISERNGLGRDFASFSGARCPNGKNWIAVYSGIPDSFRTHGKELEFDLTKLRSQCSLNSARHLKYSGGKSRLIKIPDSIKSEVTIKSSFLEPGLLLVMCRYKSDKTERVKSMLQIAIGGDETSIAHTELFQSQESAANVLFNWINALRADEQLKPVTNLPSNSEIDSIAGEMSFGTRSIAKPKILSQKLSDQKLFLDGVLSSYGSDPKEVAWGLWNTAEFRDKILSKKIVSVMIVTRQSGPHLVAHVLVLEEGTRR